MLYSPLRYPGGKNKLSAFIAQICHDNNINGHYVEPYSGGASVALFLLLEGFVEKITINDKDRSIYAFWFTVLYYTEELCGLILKTPLTVNEWKNQKKIQADKENANLLDLGFSTFYLNRTSRSGIINAGVIGGINQEGNYLMDCRYNKVELIERIKSIAAQRTNIDLFNMDAIELIELIKKSPNLDNTIFYFDPPYYLKASSLYLNHYNSNDHLLVSEKIKGITDIKWIISYDNVPEICELYQECSQKEFSFKHTAYQSRIGKEILFFSNNLKQPTISNWNPLNFVVNRKGENKSIHYKEKDRTLEFTY